MRTVVRARFMVLIHVIAMLVTTITIHQFVGFGEGILLIWIGIMLLWMFFLGMKFEQLFFRCPFCGAWLQGNDAVTWQVRWLPYTMLFLTEPISRECQRCGGKLK